MLSFIGVETNVYKWSRNSRSCTICVFGAVQNSHVDANADNNLTLEITSKNKQAVHIYQYKLLLYLPP